MIDTRPIESEDNEPLMEQAFYPWFIPRMMGDEWVFGLLLTTGQILVITHIYKIRRGFVDVKMATKGTVSEAYEVKLPLLYAHTDRLTASVKVDHIVAAFELADT